MVGRRRDRLLALKVCASSIQATETLQRFDRFSRGVLHADEDDQATTRRNNSIVQNLEA
jgi:hypothetical protein